MARDVRLIRSPLSVAGMVLTTISAVLFLVVFLADVLGLHTNPYLGILFFLVLPALFVLGLVLIVVAVQLLLMGLLGEMIAAGRPKTDWPVRFTANLDDPPAPSGGAR